MQMNLTLRAGTQYRSLDFIPDRLKDRHPLGKRIDHFENRFQQTWVQILAPARAQVTLHPSVFSLVKRAGGTDKRGDRCPVWLPLIRWAPACGGRAGPGAEGWCLSPPPSRWVFSPCSCFSQVAPQAHVVVNFTKGETDTSSD